MFFSFPFDYGVDDDFESDEDHEIDCDYNVADNDGVDNSDEELENLRVEVQRLQRKN